MSVGKWIVKVNAGFWMAGVHRFQTKKAAKEFIHEWVMADADVLKKSGIPAYVGSRAD